MRWIAHAHKTSSVIVLVINDNHIFTVKPKSQPPVPAHANRPMILQSSAKAVQLPPGGVQVSWMSGIVEGKQLQPQFVRVFGLYSGFRSGAEKPLQAAVPEAFYHT
jgi:hypothetical protein